MKLVGAILLSLLLGMAPGLASTLNWADAARPEAHRCCPPEDAAHCGAQCCWTSQDSPRNTHAPESAPAAPRAALDVPVLSAVRWTLPSPLPLTVHGAERSSASALGADVPLFLRHAALLI